MLSSASDSGKEGERIAREYLCQKRILILFPQYRFERTEANTITRDGDILVFSEVKMRDDHQSGPPELAPAARRQRWIRQAAMGFCAECDIENQVCGFDVVAIQRDRYKLDIRHIEDAF